MKFLLILMFCSIVNLTAFAGSTGGSGQASPASDPTCPNVSDPELVKADILKQESCYEAAKLAENCAWQTSIDVQFYGNAITVCKKLRGTIQVKDQETEDYLIGRCSDKYKDSVGTMWLSAISHCQLSVVRLITMINKTVVESGH